MSVYPHLTQFGRCRAVRRRLLLIACLAFMVLAVALGCCGCATLANLFNRGDGVIVRNEELQLKLYDADGKLTTTYSGSFTGTLVDTLPSGEGKFVVKSGEDASWVFSGTFVAGHFEGEGTLTWGDGSLQKGTFAKDQLVEGTCAWANGDTYIGTLADGLYQGTGTYAYADGDRYTGSFAAGVFSGQGTYTYANGDTYSGEWAQGLYHGAGVYTTADGTRYEGTFEKGVFIG